MLSNSNKGQSPEITFSVRIEILMIPENYILFLSGLTDFLIVKNPNVSVQNNAIQALQTEPTKNREV